MRGAAVATKLGATHRGVLAREVVTPAREPHERLHGAMGHDSVLLLLRLGGEVAEHLRHRL